ncbi:hypothetical protein I5U67_01375 [Stenotrophomonas maltophilia]|uniref:Uncharacterized protein n=2 Tax=Gammaproteobacteria TaxID=1236 RepID=A0A6B8J010_STEMA|nr:hypothetical protein [Stenotrophomonas maltophilia]MBH1650833.1 hypothetical protein [Stenotrophomonas maltophilia]QGM00079.1 hypothetical protein FEO89_04665 [Stenotrophomonas maltophilia]HDS1512274.1 hypothetical protein [Stenotrophomonas maltophilia]
MNAIVSHVGSPVRFTDTRASDPRIADFFARSASLEPAAGAQAAQRLMPWLEAFDKKALLASVFAGLAAVSSASANSHPTSTSTIYFHAAAPGSLAELQAWDADAALSIWHDSADAEFLALYSEIESLAEAAAAELEANPVTEQNAEAWARALIASQRG